MRLIDADRLKDYIDNCQYCDKCPKKRLDCRDYCMFPDYLTEDWERAIDEQPTIDHVKHGHWMDMPKLKGGQPVVKCSVCEITFCDLINNHRFMYHYCPNCKAKMDEVSE